MPRFFAGADTRTSKRASNCARHEAILAGSLLVDTFSGLCSHARTASPLGHALFLVAVFARAVVVGHRGHNLGIASAPTFGQAGQMATLDVPHSPLSGSATGLSHHERTASTGVLDAPGQFGTRAETSAPDPPVPLKSATHRLVPSTSNRQIERRNTSCVVEKQRVAFRLRSWICSLSPARRLFERLVRVVLRRLPAPAANAAHERRVDRGFALRQRFLKQA